MSIKYSVFLKWAIARFGEDNVQAKGKEIKINSIFESDDNGYHLWCSPSGGKKKYKYGVFHCFKTDKTGSLVKLVQLVDSCDRNDAIEKLHGKTSIRELEKKLEEFFNKQEKEIPVVVKNKLELPPFCYLISEMEDKYWKKRAVDYLTERKIPIDGLYFCTEDRYKSRVIIPYYDRNGQLIYFNGRHIGNSKCKYLGPPKEIGVGKEDVVYMAGEWPAKGETIYLCEGEFNAKSLKLCELNAAACGGKNMSEKQAIMLSDYKIVLCLDNDKAGKQGTAKMTSMISAVETVKGRGEKLMLVTPPNGINDWNEMLKKSGSVILHHYIKKNQKPLDFSFPFGTHASYVNQKLWN